MTETFDYDAYVAADECKLVEMFALDENGKLKVFTPGSDIHPREGWTLVSLVSSQED